METRTIETPWSSIFTWEDLSTLVVCLALDLLDYLIPFMAAPLYGDVLDFSGIAFCILFFNWMGAITILEIIPGLDIIPFYTISWVTWYLNSSRRKRKKFEQQLEQWK
jgi:Flp pilus assembly protein TadB